MIETVGRTRGTTTPPTAWSDPRRYLALMGSPWGRTLVRLQNAFNLATVRFWADRDVCAVHLPVTTGAVSSPMGLGSDSTPVPVELFGAPTYLADSMQFLLEYGCRLTTNGCYYVMPSFRGEAPDESHLCQFFHSEAELPGGLEELIPVIEAYVRQLGEHLLTYCADEIVATAGSAAHIDKLVADASAFERITFREAVRLLDGDEAFVRTSTSGARRWRTLTRAGERVLMARCGQFVWVTHFDHLAVPFYQAFGDEPGTAVNADLLFGLGEVVGAGERHADVDTLLRALGLHAVRDSDYEWYIEMRRVEPMRTSGFGLGVERFLMWAMQHDDIRDLQLLPRINGEVNNP